MGKMPLERNLVVLPEEICVCAYHYILLLFDIIVWHLSLFATHYVCLLMFLTCMHDIACVRQCLIVFYGVWHLKSLNDVHLFCPPT